MTSYKLLLPYDIATKAVINRDKRLIRAILYKYALVSNGSLDYMAYKPSDMSNNTIANLTGLTPQQVSVKLKPFKLEPYKDANRYVIGNLEQADLELAFLMIYQTYIEGESGSISLGVKHLADLFQCSEPTAIRIKQELQEKGYLNWVKPNPGKNSNVVLYTVNEKIYAYDFVNLTALSHKLVKQN
jgi:hypothetical protein